MGFLIGFFLKNGIRSRRILWMTLLNLIPVGCALVLLITKPLYADSDFSLNALYPQVSFLLYLHFLLPLIAVFVGAAIIGDEVEERTLPYLITRPVPKWKLILSKILANVMAVGLILFISLGCTYTVMFLDSGIGGWLSNIPKLLQSGAVIILGLLVYMPFYGVLGGTIKRPVLAGLFFTFGWESTVSFFPGNIKLFSMIHYLNILFPTLKKVDTGGDLRSAIMNLVLPATRIPLWAAVLILLLLFVLFTGLLISLLYLKEYRLEQEG